MKEILSLWRSPIDKVALSQAEALRDRQPQGTITFTTDFSAITVYNYGVYGANNHGGGPSINNDTALVDMFAAMSAAADAGGTAIIEQYNFPVDAPYPTTAMPYAVPDQSNIIGIGTGGESGTSNFFHFSISGSGSVQFFYVSGAHTSGGTYFRNLSFEWLGGSSLTGSETCIYANSWNCRAINCNFVNCPIAFNAQPQGLSSGMERCTVQYLSGPNGGSTFATEFPVIILGAPQAYVVGPGEYFQTLPPPYALGPTGITGVSIQNAEHFVIRDIHLFYWSCGINYGIGNNPNAAAGNVSFVESECYLTCVNMQCANDMAHSYAQKYTSCVFPLATNSSNPNPSPWSLFIIDPKGADNSHLEDIELNDCSIFQSNLHGLEIKGGQRIRVVGGQYSNNGPNGGAGVAITGVCGDVTIIGASLEAKYNNAAIPQSQQWALLVSGSPTGNVTVDSCQMFGYAPASPVSVTGTPSKLLITNCPGYNDQNTPVTTPGFTSNQHAAALGYYGPSVITWSNATSVTFTLNGVNFTSMFGSVYLLPYDTVQFSATPTTVRWIGK